MSDCSVANPFGMKLTFKVQSDGSVLAEFPCRRVCRAIRRQFTAA